MPLIFVRRTKTKIGEIKLTYCQPDNAGSATSDTLRDLLAHGARIPKELMLFVKNFAYLSSVIQNLSPEMDLLAEFEKISSGFFTREIFTACSVCRTHFNQVST